MIASRPTSDGRPRAARWIPQAVTLGTASIAGAALVLGAFLVRGMMSGAIDWIELFTSDIWRFRRDAFGAATMLWGTFVVSTIALLIAVPVGWSAAIALHELTPSRLRSLLRMAVELLAAIPSIVYGLLGIAFLRPLITGVFGVPGGNTLLTAGLLLCIMVLPTVVSISVDALADVPRNVRESAAALGLSRVEVIRAAVLPLAKGGMRGGAVLGLSRALGETIAIYLVIGRRDGPFPGGPREMVNSLLESGQTLTTKLGGPEPILAGSSGKHWAALCALGAILLCMVSGLTLISHSAWLNRSGQLSRLRRYGARRYRAARDAVAVTVLRLAAVAPILIAVAVCTVLVSRGSLAFDPSFWITPTRGASGGGVRNQIVGTLVLVATAGLIAASCGLALALLMGEYASKRGARQLRMATVTLGGVPTILLGLAGYWFFSVLLGWGKSWLVGGILLGLVAIPVVALVVTAQLATVPSERMETARALGLRRSQIVRSVLIPHARPALITGLLLGLARAAGETAPLLFTATVFSGTAALPTGIAQTPVMTLPTHIFTLAQDTAKPAALDAAWGAGTVLVIMIFILLTLTIPLRRTLEKERL